MIDFNNTETAFFHLADKELRKASWLFSMMNKPWLVKYGSKLGLWAIENNLPFAKAAVKSTIFDQFVGGRTLLDSQKSIDRLWAFNTYTVLDYGAEAKDTEKDFNFTLSEYMRAIDFASQTKCIPVVATKITGMARFELLERMQSVQELTKQELLEYRTVLKRIDAVCSHASKHGVSVFIDAEESWIQDSIDHLTWLMMKRYNKKRVVVYNTFQMYRHDRLEFLFKSFDKAKNEGFILGAKLVRGAYMEKERLRAEEMNCPSPIHPTKEATDDCFNTGIRFCVDNHTHIASYNASHNVHSAGLQAELMEKKGIVPNHPHLFFCQLYGMSDNITFNLAKAGYNVGKYVPYGQVEDVAPYLIRRAQENSSVAGDASREYKMVMSELKRRAKE